MPLTDPVARARMGWGDHHAPLVAGFISGKLSAVSPMLMATPRKMMLRASPGKARMAAPFTERWDEANARLITPPPTRAAIWPRHDQPRNVGQVFPAPPIATTTNLITGLEDSTGWGRRIAGGLSGWP